jgi:hypothetical protein
MITIRRLQEPTAIEVLAPDHENFPAWRVTRSDSAIIRVFQSKDDAIAYAKTLGAPFDVHDRTDDDSRRWKPFHPRQ